jgi:hypothetical protein
MRDKSPLRGEVANIREELDDKGAKIVIAKVNFGNWDVAIPHSEFMPSLKGADLPYVMDTMKSRVGSAVYFVVIALDYENNFALASRITAEQKRVLYWFKEDTKLKKGEIVTGDLVAIVDRKEKTDSSKKFQRGAIVNVSGAETLIPLAYLSHTYLRSAHDEFRVGETLQVKLIEVKLDKKTNEDGVILGMDVKFQCSHKDTYPDPATLAYNEFPENSVHRGKVTGVMTKENKTPRLYVTVNTSRFGSVTVLCFLPYGRHSPNIGEETLIKITSRRKDENSGKVYYDGTITM